MSVFGVTRRRPARRELVALLAVGAVFVVTGGPTGAVAGVGLALAAVVAPPVVTFVFGQALLLAVLPAPTTLQVVGTEAALGGLLLATPGMTRRSAVGTGLLFALGGTLVWVGVETVGLTTTAAVFAGTALAVGYLLHRYERVVVGLAGGAPT